MSSLLDVTPDPAPLSLTPDQKHASARDFDKISHIAKTLGQRAAAGTLDGDFARDMVRHLESLLANAAEALAIPAEAREVVEKRYQHERKLHTRIHELETKLADYAASVDMEFATKNLADRASHWWSTVGLGFLSDFKVLRHGECELELSGRISGKPSLAFGLSSTPVSDLEELNQFLQGWADRGLQMQPEKNDTPTVLFTPQNLDVLGKFIKEHLPSGVIVETQAYHLRGHSLKSLKVRVSAQDLSKLAKAE